VMTCRLFVALALAVGGVPVALGQSASAPAPAARPSEPASAAVAARPASPARPAAAPQARSAGRGTPSRPVMDRVDLDASQITGNRELPRVMYVVPWRQPVAGQVDGRPVNSLLYELSTSVDREVSRRELRYGEVAPPAADKAVP
jgi:hypothetical protein